MEWKPNAIYEYRDSLNSTLSFRIKIDSSGMNSIVVKQSGNLYSVGLTRQTSRWNWYSFKEVKASVNHLPEWL